MFRKNSQKKLKEEIKMNIYFRYNTCVGSREDSMVDATRTGHVINRNGKERNQYNHSEIEKDKYSRNGER